MKRAPVAEVLAAARGSSGTRRRSSRARARRRRSPAVAVRLADDLVAENERQLRVGELAVDDVQVGAADAAGAHAEQHLARARARAAGARAGRSGAPGASSTIALIGVHCSCGQLGTNLSRAWHVSGDPRVRVFGVRLVAG